MEQATVTIINQSPVVEIAPAPLALDIDAPAQVEIEITFAGARGLPGADGEVEIYEASFVASAVWIVNHNLGRKPTAVQVLNVGGTEILADIVHISDNQLQVIFIQPHTGTVRVM